MQYLFDKRIQIRQLKLVGIFLLILCIQIDLPGQTLHLASHTAIDKTGEMVSINSKQYFFSLSEDYCCGISVGLSGKDANGSSLFSIGLQVPGQVQRMGRLIVTQDQALFLSCSSRNSCDLAAGYDMIAKVDTLGNILFSVLVQSVAVSNYSPTIKDITQHPDGSYYLASFKDLYHYSTTGQFLSKITTSITDIKSLKALSNGHFYACGILNGNYKHVVMNSSANVLYETVAVSPVWKVLEDTTGIYLLSADGKIEKRDSVLNLKASSTSAINPSNYFIRNFTLNRDTVYLVGRSFQNSSAFYGMCDKQLQTLYFTNSSYKGFGISSVSVSNDQKVNIIAEGYTKTNNIFTSKGFFRINKYGTFYLKQDIGIVEATPLLMHSFPNNLGVWFLNDFQLRVKNFGLDTVKSFYINHYAKQWWCNMLLHKFCQIPIPPGGTVSVNTGTFYGQPLNQIAAGQGVIKRNVCLFTSLPDSSFDADIENDAFCDTLEYLYTSIVESISGFEHPLVYPVPFNETINIRSYSSAKIFEVFNAWGKRIYFSEKESEEFHIITSDWPAGIYILKLTFEADIIRMVKVIKP